MQRPVLFWFRRDLRVHDNHGLFRALSSGSKVIPIFIFDTCILNKLEHRDDARVSFIHSQLLELQDTLSEHGGDLEVYIGEPWDIMKQLCDQYNPSDVYTNKDYEPYAKLRDTKVKKVLEKYQCTLHTFKDHVIFEQSEILSQKGTPYTVFTPYSKAWKGKLEQKNIDSYDSASLLSNLQQTKPTTLPSLKDIGFTQSKITIPSKKIDSDTLEEYKQTRDTPSKEGTTRIGVHLRFGTISIRQAVSMGLDYESWLNELIWREFYIQVLWHFPHVTKGAFRAQYDAIPWRNDKQEFQAWCEGKTGFPIVDAGMRQLVQTGYMHNRVRMIVASFLTKDLLIDWRWGEQFFAQHLLDYELASNNGGWQWAAGTGTDAAPYFRIFNPESQLKTHDPHMEYVSTWVPEVNELTYPSPMVDHKMARQRCLDAYRAARETSN